MKFFKFLLVLILPVLITVIILIAVNYRNPIVTDTAYDPVKCNMACYHNTAYCKTHHVKYLKPYLATTDMAYFGVIDFLQSKGNYERANIIYLVVGWPALMYVLLVYSVGLQIFVIKKRN